jgi:hypothetical protein
MNFLSRQVAVCYKPSSGSSRMAYRFIPSHFEHCLYTYDKVTPTARHPVIPAFTFCVPKNVLPYHTYNTNFLNRSSTFLLDWSHTFVYSLLIVPFLNDAHLQWPCFIAIYINYLHTSCMCFKLLLSEKHLRTGTTSLSFAQMNLTLALNKNNE